MPISKYSRLADVPANFMDFWSAQNNLSYDLSPEWFQCFEQSAMESGAEYAWYCGTSKKSDKPTLIFPAQILPGPQARTLGGLANFYTSFFAPITTSDSVEKAAILDELAQFWANERPRWPAVDISPLDNHSLDFADLIRGLRRHGFAVSPYFRFGNWYLELAGRSFGEYTQSLPPQTRNTIQTKEKKLLKQPTYQIKIMAGQDGVDDFLRDYNAIYQASWKKHEPRPEFISAFVRAFAQLGWTRLGIIHLDGEPAAAQIWIVKDKIAYIYKLAYDERFSKLSPGSVLTYRLMEHAISIDEVHTVDYLTGDDNYKQAWMSHRRERWGILACNTRSARGIVQAIRHVAGPKIKRILGRS